ncbi:MAG: FCD domain-containing protein [Beijerinckiaceae bacterium]
MDDHKQRAAKSSLAEEKRAELAARLTDSIALARLAPGQRISVQSLALHLRSKVEEVKAVLPTVAQSKLMTFTDTDVIVAELDRDMLVSRLDDREMLEKQIAAAAAMKAASDHKAALESAVVSLKRAALVGDIEGYMNADRALERVIGQTSQLEAEFEKLVQIKREFRRAWCAHNRLRDLNVPAAMRESLTKSIINGDSDGAVLAVDTFVKYLRTCL